jgi:hypothetical protein
VRLDPADPFVYIALSVALLLVAQCASFFPARRATRIDPAYFAAFSPDGYALATNIVLYALTH